MSKSTVSRVINEHPSVAPQTARAVRRAMRKLGYEPSPHRPGPKPNNGRRAGATVATIAFFVLGTTGRRATPAFANLLQGVSAGATEHNLNLLFNNLPNPNALPNEVRLDNIDGVLLHGATPGPNVRKRLEQLPTVWLMGNRDRPQWGDQVMPDAYDVGELAAQYLIDQGHRILGFFNLEANHMAFRRYRQSFLAAAEQAGVEAVCFEHEAEPADDYWHRHDPRHVRELADQYLAAKPRPTGLFVADDMQVAVVQPALQARGVRLDERHTQIISCNNEQPLLVGLDPRPAVIDIRVESIGRRGVDQLVWRMTHFELTERIISTIKPSVLLPPTAE